jgi:hypothetical protein
MVQLPWHTPWRTKKGMVNLQQFSTEQSEALLDLAVLGMYSDAHLAVAEQERVDGLLVSMGVSTDYDRARLFDAAVARVSRCCGNPERTEAQVRLLTQAFSTREQRELVHKILRELLASDGKVAPREGLFLSTLRAALHPVGAAAKT